MSKIIRHVDDLKDIKLSIHTTLTELAITNDGLREWTKQTLSDDKIIDSNRMELKKISWEEYIELIKRLVSKLRASESMGDFILMLLLVLIKVV